MEIAPAFLHQVQEDGAMSESETFEDNDDEEEELYPPESQRSLSSAMIMRRASVNVYNGEGMEIADWDLQEDLEEQRRESLENWRHAAHHISQVLEDDEEEPSCSIFMSASFDETQSEDRLVQFPGPTRGPGTLQRSYSEDELSALLTEHLYRGKFYFSIGLYCSSQ